MYIPVQTAYVHTRHMGSGMCMGIVESDPYSIYIGTE